MGRTVTISILFGVLGVLFLIMLQMPTDNPARPWGMSAGVLLTGTASWSLLAQQVPGLSRRTKRAALITSMVIAAATVLLNGLALFVG